MDRLDDSCQLYLIIPPELDQQTKVNLGAAISSGKITCAQLRADINGNINRDFAANILRLMQHSQVPVLFENDVAAAADLGADGVHIAADEERYTEARRLLGDDAIIGVDCGLSRHAGLTLGEMGADYVAFADSVERPPCWNGLGLKEIITWWSETITVPCIAWDISSADEARLYSQAGADFVAIGEPIWSHAKGPAKATAEFSESLMVLQIWV